MAPAGLRPTDVDQGQQPAPRIGDLTGIVAEQWLDPLRLADLGANGEPLDTPIVIDGFLEPDFASDLANGMREARSWRRFAFAYTGGTAAIQVADAVWAETPGAVARYTVLDDPGELVSHGSPRTGSHRAYRRWFASAIVTHSLQRWYEALLGVPVGDQISIEMNRLERGDELRPHQDLHQGRIVNSCIYLDPDHRPGNGGEFGFSVNGAPPTLLEPCYNRLIVIPLGSALWHWVEPYAAQRGRECIAVGIQQQEHADTPEHEGRGRGGL